jgi:glycosyltransferase involved in cell wall biosynthesis
MVHDYGSATGGAENQMLRLRELLRAKGHEALLFSSRATLIPGAIVEADRTCYGGSGVTQVLSAAWNWSASHELQKLIREFQPQVVHVRMFLWQLSPSILPLLRNIPALYQTATYKSICPTGTKLLPSGAACQDPPGFACLRNQCVTPRSWLPLMFQRGAWLRNRHVFKAIVALSHTMKQRLEENGVGPVEVIYNGVRERPMRPPLQGVPVIGYAGRLAPEKGIGVLIGALQQLAAQGLNFRFRIAGDGPLREAIRGHLDAAGLRPRTDFFGYLPRPAMEAAFDACWAQAIPSLWDEPFGNVATEALMRGTAVVTSSVGGLAEIVEDGVSGIHVPPNDAPALAAALASIITNPARAEAMGQAGRIRALTHFSESACLQSFLALYERLITP